MKSFYIYKINYIKKLYLYFFLKLRKLILIKHTLGYTDTTHHPKKITASVALVLPIDTNVLIIFIKFYVPAAGYKRLALFPTVYSFDVTFLIAVAIA